MSGSCRCGFVPTKKNRQDARLTRARKGVKEPIHLTKQLRQRIKLQPCALALSYVKYGESITTYKDKNP